MVITIFNPQKNLNEFKVVSITEKTIRSLEENIRIILCDLRSLHGFLDLTPKSQATRGKETNWDSLTIRAFVHWRTFSRQRKDKLQNWRKYLQVTYQMGFPSRISKELSQFSYKTDDPVLKTGNVLELIHLQWKYANGKQAKKKLLKKITQQWPVTSLVTVQMLIENNDRCHFTHAKWLKFKKKIWN